MPDRVMPYDNAAEQAILGVCLVDNDAIPIVTENISDTQYFYSPAHRRIYDIVKKLQGNGISVDITTVADQLERTGYLKKTGGRPYLAELAAGVVSSANVIYWCDIVTEKYLYRMIIDKGTQEINAAYSQSEEPLDLLHGSIGSTFELMADTTQESFKLMSEHSSSMLEKLIRVKNKEVSFGIPTGFKGLDELTGGFSKGDLIIVGGRPSMGKTAFMDGIARNMAKAGTKVGFISAEMSQEAFVLRSHCSMAGVDSRAFRRGSASAEEWIKFDEAIETMKKMPYSIYEGRNVTIESIISKTMLAAKHNQLEALFVDYIQIIGANDKKLSRFERVSQASSLFKELAMKLDIPVTLGAQLSREIDTRRNKRPMLSDMRDSGDIEQDADLIIFPHRPEVYNTKKQKEEKRFSGMADIIVAKQRNGPTGEAEMFFRKVFSRFEEVSQVDMPF